jgi:hypothetical protein
MTHPSDEQWMGYLYGEAERPSRAALAEHLRSCPDCRARVDTWGKAIAELDAWELPRVPRHRSVLQPVIKWAVAATVVLGVGYGLGRLARPSAPEPGPLAAQFDERLASLESSLGTSLRQELGEAVATEVSVVRADLEEQLGEMLGAQTEEVVTGTVLASRDETARLLAAFAERVELARLEDRRLIAELVRRLESRRLADHVALEHDLKALAVLAGVEFLRTEQAVAELVSLGPPFQAASEIEESPGTSGP